MMKTRETPHDTDPARLPPSPHEAGQGCRRKRLLSPRWPADTRIDAGACEPPARTDRPGARQRRHRQDPRPVDTADPPPRRRGRDRRHLCRNLRPQGGRRDPRPGPPAARRSRRSLHTGGDVHAGSGDRSADRRRPVLPRSPRPRHGKRRPPGGGDARFIFRDLCRCSPLRARAPAGLVDWHRGRSRQPASPRDPPNDLRCARGRALQGKRGRLSGEAPGDAHGAFVRRRDDNRPRGGDREHRQRSRVAAPRRRAGSLGLAVGAQASLRRSALRGGRDAPGERVRRFSRGRRPGCRHHRLGAVRLEIAPLEGDCAEAPRRRDEIPAEADRSGRRRSLLDDHRSFEVGDPGPHRHPDQGVSGSPRPLCGHRRPAHGQRRDGVV